MGTMKKTMAVFFLLMLIVLFPRVSGYAEQIDDTPTFIFPSSLNMIEEEAFAGTPVKNVILPDGFQYIGENAFEGDSALTDIYIPSTTEYIADTAFPMNSDLVIYGVEDSYAQEWAEENNIPFAVENIWKPIVDNGKTASIQEVGLAFLFQIVIPKKIIKIGSRAEDESLRPQDRPELYPIDYSFP